MKEKHYAYKITKQDMRIDCSSTPIQHESMSELLKEIKQENTPSLYWVFKQLANQPEEALCIVDCAHNRIYYQYSGIVDELTTVLDKLKLHE